MQRKLAVPLALSGHVGSDHAPKIRNLRGFEVDGEDLDTLSKLVENRQRIENLLKDIESQPSYETAEDIEGDLDYLKAGIQLGLLEIAGELEEIKTSDEIFDASIA